MPVSIESIQFEVGLTRNKAVLDQLKRNGMWHEDKDGFYLSIQFDSQEFKFRPGKTFIVGKTVGNALIRSSAVLLGSDPLSDPYIAYVEKVSESQLGEEKKVNKSPQFACPICGEDQKSGPKLARHLMDRKVHKSEPSAEEMAGEEAKATGAEFDSADGADEGA